MRETHRVPRVGELSKEAFADRYYCRSPVIITDAMKGWKTVGWTLVELRARFAGAKLPLRMHDREFDAYCEAAGDSLLRAEKEARRIVVGDRFFWIIRMDAYFGAAMRGAEACGPLPSVLDVPLSNTLVLRYLQVMNLDKAEDWSPLVAALESLAADVDFPQFLTGDRDQRFWFTPRPRPPGTIHADGYHNLNAQVRGRKEWSLQSPEQRVAGGEAITCVTHEGEMLYIPRGWWHAATALDSSINVNAWHTPR